MFKSFWPNILFLLSFVFICSGCEDKSTPPVQPKIVSKKIIVKNKKPAKEITAPSKVKTDKEGGEIIAGSEQPAAKITTYNPEGKIDPFASLFKTSKPAAKNGEKQKNKEVICTLITPLQKFDLGQLKLAGIIRTPGGNTAMVEEASGRGYILKKGTFIGTNCGRVEQILKDRIIVKEPLLPVDSVDKDFMYNVNGKNFFVTEIKGRIFTNINDSETRADITNINGRAYYMDVQELKLQKPPGE
jgi:type IV pilus assembly protein PilP